MLRRSAKPADALRPPRRRLPRGLRDGLTDALLVTPALFGLLILIVAPVAVVAILAFTDYQFGARRLDWVGLDNFATLFIDPIGRRALTNTLLYAVIVVPASIGIALAVALGIRAVATRAPATANVLKAAYFLPVAGTLVAMSLVWQMLLHPTLGPVNQALVAVGLPAQAWLSDRSLVLVTLAIIGVWQTIGYNMILFLAGLAAIPPALYDAATVDGASRPLARFLTVTWPMLGPTTVFVALVTAINAFRVFETVATLTRGGPAFASDTLVWAIYREGFVYFKAGYASAITMVFFAVVLVLTLVQFRLADRQVHYR